MGPDNVPAASNAYTRRVDYFDENSIQQVSISYYEISMWFPARGIMLLLQKQSWLVIHILEGAFLNSEAGNGPSEHDACIL